MKIVMLGWELPPYNTGGLGVACYHLCKSLSHDGATIDFVVPYQEQHEDIDFMRVIPAIPYGIEVLRTAGSAYASQEFGIGAQSLAGSLRAQQAQYTKAVRALVHRESYDIIHAHDWLTFEAAMAAKQETGRPFIAHVHATEFDRSGGHYGNPLIHEIEYNALSLADRIIAISQGTKDLIARNYSIPSDKIEIVHNSINPQELVPLDAHNAYAYLSSMKRYGYKVVVNVGRLTVQKGLIQLLEAARLAIQKFPKLLFLIAGTGEQFPELVAKSAELGISQHIIFTAEFVRGKAWRDAFAIGDMFVLPSVSEPFGLTVLEAIGYGSPALISKQAGVGEVMRNVLKFDFWDIQKLADQIVAVAQHESLHDELRTQAFAELQTLSWQHVAEKCEEVYRKITEPYGVHA